MMELRKLYYMLLTLLILSSVLQGQQPDVNYTWTHNARIIGTNFNWESSSDSIHSEIDKHFAEGVSVMLVWTKISNAANEYSDVDSIYLNDVVSYTHTNYPEMKVVLYVGPLERQTTDVDMNQDGKVDSGKTSIYTEHPEWLQVSIDGDTAVFYGSVAFWIDPTSEDTWICPNDPVYSQIWINNFKKIAETGIDGVWWDGPFFIHYFGDTWDGKWSCACSDCKTKYLDETGNNIPTVEDWNNPNWRSYINWRFNSMGQLMRDCNDEAKTINPDIVLFNETWNAIDQFEPQVGFEPNTMRTNSYNDGIAHEEYPLEPADYHYYSWLFDAALGKAYRGTDQERASWVLNYSDDVEHAKTRCSNTLFTSCNFYEVNYPNMSSTVDLNLRTLMLNWIKNNQNTFYDKDLKNYTKVAILYSPPSLYYYGSYPEAYAEEFKGLEMMLLESHITYEVLPVDKINNLSNYSVLILPNVTALSDSNIDTIKSFVNGGGKLISTGWTSYFNDDGSQRGSVGLIDVFGQEPQEGVYHQNQYGNGTSISTRDILGINYYYDANPREKESESHPISAEYSRNKFLTKMWEPLNVDEIIDTQAPKELIFNTFLKQDTLFVRVENLVGLRENNDLPTQQNNIDVTILLPDNWDISSAEQMEFLENKTVLNFTKPDLNHIACTIDIKRQKILSFVNANSTKILLQTKIFLEGAYNLTSHQMDANLGNNIPKTSPYSEDPRTVQSIPSNIVDWVLVQLRTTSNGAAITSHSAFLNKDGRIVDDDGTTGEIKLNAAEGDYYIVVKHRNHLAVMSANKISLNSTNSTLYDFTTGSDKYYGSDGSKQLE